MLGSLLVKSTTAVSALNSVLAGLKPEMHLVDAIQLLQDHGLSGAPVIDDAGQVVGVLSDESCLRLLVQDAYERSEDSLVGDAMTSPPPCVHDDTPLPVVAERMVAAGTSCVVVLNRDDVLVGQINREDLVDAMLELVRDRDGGRFVGWRQNRAQQAGLTAGEKPRMNVRDSVGTETNWVYRRALESGSPEEGGGAPPDYPYPGHRRQQHSPSEKPAGKS